MAQVHTQADPVKKPRKKKTQTTKNDSNPNKTQTGSDTRPAKAQKEKRIDPDNPFARALAGFKDPS